MLCATGRKYLEFFFIEAVCLVAVVVVVVLVVDVVDVVDDDVSNR